MHNVEAAFCFVMLLLPYWNLNSNKNVPGNLVFAIFPGNAHTMLDINFKLCWLLTKEWRSEAESFCKLCDNKSVESYTHFQFQYPRHLTCRDRRTKYVSKTHTNFCYCLFKFSVATIVCWVLCFALKLTAIHLQFMHICSTFFSSDATRYNASAGNWQED